MPESRGWKVPRLTETTVADRRRFLDAVNDGPLSATHFASFNDCGKRTNELRLRRRDGIPDEGLLGTIIKVFPLRETLRLPLEEFLALAETEVAIDKIKG